MKYIELSIKDQCFQIKAEKLKDQIWFHFKGQTFCVDRHPAPQTAEPTSSQKQPSLAKGQVLAPMPGQIVQIAVRLQQQVKENQTLLILSSMKMEYIIRAPTKGVVKSIQTQEGAQVSAQELLMEIHTPA